MSQSYLGPHLSIIGNCDGFFSKAQPRIAKLLVKGADPERLRQLAKLSPSTIWIGRIVLDDQNLQFPAQSGRELAERIIETAQRFPEIDYWEGYNEISFTRYQDETDPARRQEMFRQAAYEMAVFAEHEIQRTLTLHRAGLKSIVGNFSTGTPEFDLWPFFYPALEYADALGLHEYDAPGMRRLETWLCGRFARIYEMLPPEYRKPLAITECSIDGGVIGDGRAGWKRYMDASSYMRELVWYDGRLQSYATRWPILGATVFCWGGAWGWQEYDIDGELARLLTDYIASTRKVKTITLWRRVIELLERITKGKVT